MKVIIKLSRRHPHDAMNFGRHVVTYQEQEIELNENEKKDLKNDGPKHWFIIKEVKTKEPKKVNKKVSKKVR